MASVAQRVAIKTAKAVKRLRQTQAPPRPRKPKAPKLTKRMVLRATKDSRGIIKIIAEKCRCCYQTIANARDRWPEVALAIQEETEKLADEAVVAIRDAINQRIDLNTATLNARWVLSRQKYANREMTDVQKVVHEGGDKPLQVQNGVSVDTLDLSIEVRRSILEALEKKAMQSKGEPSET